jgi:hypothetical protein
VRPPSSPVVVALLLLVIGCGVQSQDRPEQVPPERLPAPSETASPEAAAGSAQVWGSRDGQLVPVFVQLSDPADLRERIDAMLSLAGSGEEPPTVTPTGTRLVEVLVRDGTCVVELSEQAASASARDMPLVIAQVVLTVTEVPGVERVQVRAASRTLPFLSSEGRPLERSLTREDVAPLAVAGSLDE